MHFGVAALLVAVAASAAAQERQERAPQTDQTVSVARGSRLSIDNFAGEVVIHTWDRDSLRVQARHPSRTKIAIRSDPGTVSISATSGHGPAGSVDYDITAPAWLPMKIEGQFNYVTIEGAQGEVSVETVRGDILLKGVSGSVTGKTIEGEIAVEGGRGKINLSSVNQGIKVTGASGEITAETTNGSITLARIESASVDATTVNGDITYEGTIANGGRYSLTTHNGDLTMTVPDSTSATFSVRTYNGDFGSSLSLKGPDASEARRGKRVSYVAGTGSAQIELESFGGEIRVRRAGGAKSGRSQ